jgi:hypothetical protein
LQSLVNVGAEDDDGNKASEPAKKQSLQELPASGDKFDKAKKFIQEGGLMEDISKKYLVTDEVKNLLISK